MSNLSIVAIVPLYNGAKWIEQAIASVLSQTRQPDEFIVVDDGSTDDGPAIVEGLAQKHPIKLFRKPNGGQSSARNYGVANSKSDLIALLDQDDAWYPHHLEKLLGPFRHERGIPLGWTYSDIDEIDESGGTIHHNFHDFLPVMTRCPNVHPKASLGDCLANNMYILPSASLISRKAFEAVGGFDERLCGYEDDDFFLRLFRAGYRSEYIKDSLSQWRIYATSTSHRPCMAKSRMIYARKLLDWGRRYIAPRFLRCAVLNFAASLEHRDAELFRLSLAHIGDLWPHLTIRHRMIALALIVSARTGLIHAVYAAREFVRPIVRLVAQ
jgi:glycosyltransferase involved in cell wall biosynthesis